MTEKKTVEEVAKDLRAFAELTANYSKNWDNFQEICKEALQAVYDGGKSAAN
jgi:hypothetical protein